MSRARERRWSQGGGLSKPVARRRRMEQWGAQQRKTAATTNTDYGFIMGVFLGSGT